MYKKLLLFLTFTIFFVSFPEATFGGGGMPRLEVCGPVAISRNIEYVFFSGPESDYAHLFGDRLAPHSFYLLYGKSLGASLSEEDFSKIGNHIQTGRYEEPSRDYYDGHLNVNRGQDSFRLVKETLEDRESRYSEEEFNYLKENYENIPYDGALYPIEDEGYIVDCDDIETAEGEVFYTAKEAFESSKKESEEEVGFLKRIMSVIKEFFQRIFLFLLGGEEDSKEPKKDNVLDRGVYKVFNHEGSGEFLRDQEYQNAMYYFYRASFTNDCDYKNAERIFRGIMNDKESPWNAHAHLGYVRVLVRRAAIYNNKHTFEEENGQRHRFWFKWENNFNTQPEIEERYQEALKVVNEYIEREDLSSVRADLLFQKNRMLLYFFDEEEFLQSAENIDKRNSTDLLRNLSIFNGQLKLLNSLQEKGVETDFDVENYPEFTQLLYYWNLEETSPETIEEIKRKKDNFVQKDMWLTLLLRKVSLSEEHEIEEEYIDTALSQEKGDQLYYPLNYYANKIIYRDDVPTANENVSRMLEDESIPTIPYNYFSELAIEKYEDIEKAIGYVYKRIDSGIVHEGRRPEQKEDDNEKKEFVISNNPFYYAIKREIPIVTIYKNPMFREHQKRTLLFNALRLNRSDIFNILAGEIAEAEGDHLMYEATLHSHNDTKAKFLMMYAILSQRGCYLHSERTCFSGEQDRTPPSLFEDRLTKEQKEQKKEEQKVLNESIIKSFAEIIFDYHAINRQDNRIPESLHMLTFYNRYCVRDESGWPRKVFRFLHDNYPNSKWAEKTPYYY